MAENDNDDDDEIPHHDSRRPVRMSLKDFETFVATAAPQKQNKVAAASASPPTLPADESSIAKAVAELADITHEKSHLGELELRNFVLAKPEDERPAIQKRISKARQVIRATAQSKDAVPAANAATSPAEAYVTGKPPLFSIMAVSEKHQNRMRARKAAAKAAAASASASDQQESESVEKDEFPGFSYEDGRLENFSLMRLIAKSEGFFVKRDAVSNDVVMYEFYPLVGDM